MIGCKVDVNSDKLARMKELQEKLSEASDAYYNKDIELISNYEYDALYDELVELEDETGVILPGSITQRTGTPIASDTDLPKIAHETPMLSLSKTKSRSELSTWLGDKTGCLSWKLDGSTVVLTYDDGVLIQAVTRGNGYIGEDITRQARKFAFVPQKIDFVGKLIVRGEALMSYDEFERINKLQPESLKYKNPRNLASGTMRALDENILNERIIEFHPFTLVSADGYDNNSYSECLDWLDSLGFVSVEHKKTNSNDLFADIDWYESHIVENKLPSDGLVLFFDDIAYGDSLGMTEHAPRNGIAFKWQDATKRTTIRDVFWSASRTGRLNPVAVFDSVDIDGTEVERASLHNITYINDMKLNIGDEVLVYKSNMIIPQIAVNISKSLRDVHEVLPEKCPVCGAEIELRNDNESEYAYCPNSECPAKRRGGLAHFVGRDAMNVQGLNDKKLQVLIDNGIVEKFADIFDIPEKKDRIATLAGFGKQSSANLAMSVAAARECTAARFVYALGIKEVGRGVSRDLCAAFDNDVDAMLDAAARGDVQRFVSIDGIGSITAREIVSYLTANKNMIEELLDKIIITDCGIINDHVNDNSFCSGKTFVITGKLETFANRDELKHVIESLGGRVAGSVSKTTDYLVTNTPESGTKKNLDATRFGVKLITESEFVAMSAESRYKKE